MGSFCTADPNQQHSGKRSFDPGWLARCLPAHEHGPPAERGLPGGERGLLHQLLHPPPHLLQPAERAGWFLLQKLD